MRPFSLMGSASTRAALYNACHVGCGMATSLCGTRDPGRLARENYSSKSPARLDFGLTASFCVPICSQHSPRLHFEDSQCRLQFMSGLSHFRVYATFILQGLQQTMRPCHMLCCLS